MEQIRCSKRLGQHLLAGAWLDDIVESAQLAPGDSVLEIGAGPGNLTGRLCRRAGAVVAVEIDGRFAGLLEKLSERCPSLEVVHGDFLSMPLSRLTGGGARWKVVANIPYYITTPIIEKLIEEGKGSVGDAYLLMQEEVARRIVSRGGRESGALSIYVQYHCDPRILLGIPPEAFHPPPEVRSALLHLAFRPEPAVAVDETTFFTLVRTVFRFRRKTMKNGMRSLPQNLSGKAIEEILSAARVPPAARPESLVIEDFARVCAELRRAHA